MNKIPKIIHYCWFGGNSLSEKAHECIESWKKFCPGYEIIEWNESNFDIHCCRFVEEAYVAKKWAFVADYARFYAMYTIGGIYLETDSELIKPIDELLLNSAFFGFGPKTMTLPLCGTEKNAPIAMAVMQEYKKRSFIKGNGYNLKTINQTLFDILVEQYGMIHNNEYQVLKEGVAIYPKEYFFSTDWKTGIVNKTPELYVIHYADASWLDENEKIHTYRNRKLISLFGEKIGTLLGDTIYVLEKDGISNLLHHGKRYLIRTFGSVYMKLVGAVVHCPRKIVFENFAGKGYGDNPKYIARELISRKLDYDLVWLIDRKNKYEFPKGIRTVYKGTWHELFELASAKIWIDNNRKAKNIVKNKRQIYIQTWHGFYPLKKIERDAEKSLTPEYIECAKHDAEMTDLMVSGCRARTELYKNSFWYDGEIVEWGTPRNDILFEDKDFKSAICSKYNFEITKNIVLYAPTFRDDHSIEAYNLDYKGLIESLNKKFGREWVCLLKLHPAVREKSHLLEFDSCCIDVSGYDDIQELFMVADMFVTDYSNTMFEFMLTKKPVILYASDIKEYTDGRSFYYELEQLPFMIAKNNDDLRKIISSFDDGAYQRKINNFVEEIGSFEMGCASSRVVDYIISKTKV